MAKIDAFQDLAITAAEDGQELWRWLYSEIRAVLGDNLRSFIIGGCEDGTR
jgi:hypothetical protein